MAKCGKGCMPECEYFTTGGCVSPFNCSYKVENESVTTAISAMCNLYPLETDKDREISRLKAENTELRATLSKMETVEKELKARLEKAVELPCKLGDTIYKVYDRCDGYNCPYNGNYGQWRCHYEGERRCEPFIKIEQFCYSDIPFVNDTVFVSREAAEARLKEMKEK